MTKPNEKTKALYIAARLEMDGYMDASCCKNAYEALGHARRVTEFIYLAQTTQFDDALELAGVVHIPQDVAKGYVDELRAIVEEDWFWFRSCVYEEYAALADRLMRDQEWEELASEEE